jgi:hypothetical protein
LGHIKLGSLIGAPLRVKAFMFICILQLSCEHVDPDEEECLEICAGRRNVRSFQILSAG